MIPSGVMYVVAAILALWGIYRLSLGWKPGKKWRVGHIFFGVLYVCMALYLILTTARVVPPPRLLGGPTQQRGPEPQAIEVVPLSPLPLRPSLGDGGPGSQPKATVPGERKQETPSKGAVPAAQDRKIPSTATQPSEKKQTPEGAGKERAGKS